MKYFLFSVVIKCQWGMFESTPVKIPEGMVDEMITKFILQSKSDSGATINSNNEILIFERSLLESSLISFKVIPTPDTDALERVGGLIIP